MELSAGYLLGLTRASTDRTNEAWAPPAAVLSPPPPPLLPLHSRREIWYRKKIIKYTFTQQTGSEIKLNEEQFTLFLSLRDIPPQAGEVTMASALVGGRGGKCQA